MPKHGLKETGRDTMVVITRRMIQLVDCPKCGAKSEESCGQRKNKMISHHERMQEAQLLYKNPYQWDFNKSIEQLVETDEWKEGVERWKKELFGDEQN
jgi:Zn ribbon nucleic-acid-binding protein